MSEAMLSYEGFQRQSPILDASEHYHPIFPTRQILRATTRGTSVVRTILSVLGYADAHEGRNLESGTPRYPLCPQPEPQSERLGLGEGEDEKRGVNCAASDQRRPGWGESSVSWIHSTYPLLPQPLSHAHVRSSGRTAIFRR